jgi:RNA polymerase-binding transcription factor DksA
MSAALRKCEGCLEPIAPERLGVRPDARVCDNCIRTRKCDYCWRSLGEARLEALPDTRLCPACSEVVGGEKTRVIVEKSEGKIGGLKLTGTSIHVQEKRRSQDDMDDRILRHRRRAGE